MTLKDREDAIEEEVIRVNKSKFYNARIDVGVPAAYIVVDDVDHVGLAHRFGQLFLDGAAFKVQVVPCHQTFQHLREKIPLQPKLQY